MDATIKTVDGTIIVTEGEVETRFASLDAAVEMLAERLAAVEAGAVVTVTTRDLTAVAPVVLSKTKVNACAPKGATAETLPQIPGRPVGTCECGCGRAMYKVSPTGRAMPVIQGHQQAWRTRLASEAAASEAAAFVAATDPQAAEVVVQAAEVVATAEAVAVADAPEAAEARVAERKAERKGRGGKRQAAA